ncbi:hypothetical protein [Vibrio navarrensis]|uniref:hypothetical protein n=1 Tax=Vibrio navarrensis TaxID=29495 RepID=UPI00186A32CD|nr:hypothetical protein [Vibrio navarrensis]
MNPFIPLGEEKRFKLPSPTRTPSDPQKKPEKQTLPQHGQTSYANRERKKGIKITFPT